MNRTNLARWLSLELSPADAAILAEMILDAERTAEGPPEDQESHQQRNDPDDRDNRGGDRQSDYAEHEDHQIDADRQRAEQDQGADDFLDHGGLLWRSNAQRGWDVASVGDEQQLPQRSHNNA